MVVGTTPVLATVTLDIVPCFRDNNLLLFTGGGLEFPRLGFPIPGIGNLFEDRHIDVHGFLPFTTTRAMIVLLVPDAASSTNTSTRRSSIFGFIDFAQQECIIQCRL